MNILDELDNAIDTCIEDRPNYVILDTNTYLEVIKTLTANETINVDLNTPLYYQDIRVLHLPSSRRTIEFVTDGKFHTQRVL